MLFTARLAEIDARGLDALVPQEVGQQTQIGVNGQEVFGKAVAEGVGVHQGGIEVQPLRPNTEHGADAPRGDAATAVVDKERPDDVCAALCDPRQRLVAQREGDVDAPLFVAFGIEIDEAAAHMLHTKLHQLAHPRTGGGEKAHHEVPTQFAQLSQSPREIEIVGLADDVFDERAPPEAHAFEPPLRPPQREEPTIDGHHALIHGLGRIVLHEGAAMSEQILLVERREARQEVAHRLDIGAHGVGGEVVVDEALLKCRQTGMGIDVLAHKCRDLRGFSKPSYGFPPKYFGSHAIIGNPPYQVVVAQKETANGQKRSSSVFQYFQELSDQLQPRYSSLIYPAVRWIHRSGKGMLNFGLKQINDPHLSRLHFYPNSNEVFREVDITDGLSVVFKDREKNAMGFDYLYTQNGVTRSVRAQAPGEDMFVLDPEAATIGENIRRITAQRFAFLHDAVLSQKLFSIESDFVERNPDQVRPYEEGDVLAADEIKLLTNDRAGSAGRARWFIANEDVITTGKEYIRRWKVVVSSAHPGGHNRSNQLEVLDDRSAFGRSRVALKTFATEREARNFFAYCQTDFVRYTFLLTDESLSSLAKMVPDLLDYSDDNGVIDYAGDVNAQLYALFEVDDSMQRLIARTLDGNQS